MVSKACHSVVKKLILLFIITRIFLFFFPWIFRIFFSEPHIYQNLYDYLIESWNYWDAPHFLYVAEHWYTNQGDPSNFIVFLPFYPMVIAGVMLVIKIPVIAGIITSILAFILTIPLLYKLLKTFMTRNEVYKSIWFLIIFPTSLFLSAPYSESTYLLLWSIAFLAAFQKRWVIAGIATGFAVITRNFGILILPSLLIHWYLQKNKNLKDLLFLICPTFIAVIMYLLLNQYIYDNPLAFQRILHEHWQKSFSFPLSSFVNTWKLALNNNLDHYSLTVGWSEAIAMTLSYSLTPFAYKKLPKALFVYHLLATLLISSTSFILSSPRYLISIPTIFFILGMSIKNKVLIKSIEFLFIGVLFLLTYVYTRGQWAF